MRHFIRSSKLDRSLRFLTCMVVGLTIGPATGGFADESRPRLIVMTDIGGDPDDQQSLIRLMVYANEFRIEGLIATASGTPGELKVAQTRVDLIREIIAAYGKVRPNLDRHAEGWPQEQALLECVKSGNPNRGRNNVGQGHDTDGSNWLIQRVDQVANDDPVNLAIWGGQTDLAQSLWRVREDRGAKGLADFVTRLRIYDIADQDGIADWMRDEFPGLFYILSKAAPGTDKRNAAFRGMYLGGDQSLTSREWIDKHVRSTGALGEQYPTKTWTAPNPHGCMKEGDTPSWFFFLPGGGNDPNDPTRSGWGGQFYKADDGWYHDDDTNGRARDSVSRWRPVFQKDFATRMSWCRPSAP